MTAEQEAWQEWCQARTAMVQAVPGNLALVSFQGVGENPEDVEEVEGLQAERRGDEQGVWVTVADGTGADIDGTPVSGTVFLERLRPDGTPLLHTGQHWIDAFSLDGSDFELRIYDEQADNLDNFDGIEVYPYNPEAIFKGRFTEHETTDAVAWDFTREADKGHKKQVPGSFSVDIDGTTHEMVAFQDGGELVLVFSDGTTGESYAPGRFLRVPRPAGSQDLVVDFNRAFIPPCGFSDFYSCPIPPASNKLPVPLPAGEKKVLWKVARY